jgi:hypothetical protein
MANFTPIPPNYYTRKSPINATVGTELVQQSGINRSGGKVNPDQATRRRLSTPGVAFDNTTDAFAQSNYVPAVNLNGVVGGAVAGSIAGAIVGGSEGAAIGAVVGAGVAAYYNPGSLNPSLNRLSVNGLPRAGVFTTGIDSFVPMPDDTGDIKAAFTSSNEDRVIISDQTGKFIGTSANFRPLEATGGVLFPYTPVIALSHRANYEMEGLLQTNYTTPYYTKSSVDSISIQGRFTAQNEKEANYILAMMNFMRTATKMFYGASQNRGTPPPVLYLDGYGQNLFDHIPVVISEFQYSMPNDCHYITTRTYISGRTNKVPVDLNVTINAIPTYSRNKISNEFDLVAFSNGGLLTSGVGRRSGGWI